MTGRQLIIGGVALGIISIIVMWQQKLFDGREALPDFASYSQVGEKKQAFFNYLQPRVKKANQQLRSERLKIVALKQALKSGTGSPGDLSEQSKAYLRQLATRYRVPDRDDLNSLELLDQLLFRVDEIPPSLVLAQAANESAWGTSSFARNQLNLFGIWCYTENCGVIPKHRAEGATHQVAAFESVQACIEYYLLNLNSHPAYLDLRKLRAGLRQRQVTLSGVKLASGLLRYSERGQLYVDELKEMIRFNHLDGLDEG